ncbi:MAG: rhodanese-like domain-containing protein, partial [Treponema sp.]|nr:rhodanese-like domain-containing protein [Treponema sp.]
MFKIFSKFKRNIKYKNTREVANINQITYEELLEKVKLGAILLDVRTKQEFMEGHLNGAIVIPYYELSKRIENIASNKAQEIIVYCKNGGRGITAVQILNDLGYKNVYNLKGGMEGI